MALEQGRATEVHGAAGADVLSRSRSPTQIARAEASARARPASRGLLFAELAIVLARGQWDLVYADFEHNARQIPVAAVVAMKKMNITERDLHPITDLGGLSIYTATTRQHTFMTARQIL